MENIEKVIKKIEKLDEKSMDIAEKRLNNLLKPPKSLGNLEKIILQLSGIYKTADIENLKKAVLLFASDNEIVEEKVSKDNQELTKWHFPNMIKKYSAIGSICDMTGTHILAIDVGINTDKVIQGIIDEKISKGTRNMTKGPSMTKKEAIQSIKIGMKYAKTAIDKGYNILFLGEMGIGNTTPATAIVSFITDKNPSEITGRGSGIDDQLLQNKINAIKKAININNPDKNDYIDILSKLGGYETGAMLGAMIQASANNIPIVLDGLITYSVALLAKLVDEKILNYLLSSHTTREKAGKYALEYLNIKPILDLDLCLGEGYGAVLYSHIIDSAIYSYKNMYTFEETFKIRDDKRKN